MCTETLSLWAIFNILHKKHGCHGDSSILIYLKTTTNALYIYLDNSFTSSLYSIGLGDMIDTVTVQTINVENIIVLVQLLKQNK